MLKKMFRRSVVLIRVIAIRQSICCKTRLLHQVSRELPNLRQCGNVLQHDSLTINNVEYCPDNQTNTTSNVVEKAKTYCAFLFVHGCELQNVGRNLHKQFGHPLYLIKQRIEKFFYHHYTNRICNPRFSVFDTLSPIVTVRQNFDSLLIPQDHVSRSLSDTYYINSSCLLRTHTSAHQYDLISSGLDAFLVFGDVYRRDEIDTFHYPVFHQAEGVRLFTQKQLFENINDSSDLGLFEISGKETLDKQHSHSMETAKLLEHSLKVTLLNLTEHLFGKDVKTRWADQHFPFTHPSWELEVECDGEWLEVVGCGIIQQELLNRAGAGDHVGWAFGLGLERLAMKLYRIPDIRIFWSRDSGFLSQFLNCHPDENVKFKMFSRFPQCINDISFWIPDLYSPNDFYDLVRCCGQDLVEQVNLSDVYTHQKTNRVSHCYRIVYRHMGRTLTQKEVNAIHFQIAEGVEKQLGGEVRC